MTKRYATLALIYAIIAMIFGIFYREFTKFFSFTGKTNLSIIHTHYFILGMVFFFLLMLAEKNFSFSEQKGTSKIIMFYQIGLNITGLGFLIRGLTQVWNIKLNNGMDAALSGFAGLGHTILGISLILILLQIKKKIA